MSKRSADGLYKRGPIFWGWRRKSPGAPLTRASTGCRDRQAARLVKAEWERMAADPARYAADKATLGQALSAYMDHQQTLGLSPHTVKTYDLHCRQLARVLDQDTPLKAIGRHSFETHIKQREAEGMHPHTVSRELVRLRAVLVEAKHKGLYPHELTGIRPRYSKQYVPRKRALPMDELMRLGRQLRADRLAHVAFVVATGCRFVESCRAMAGHITPEGYVYLDGSKTELAKRTIPIAPPLRPFLEFALRNAPGSKGETHGRSTDGNTDTEVEYRIGPNRPDERAGGPSLNDRCAQQGAEVARARARGDEARGSVDVGQRGPAAGVALFPKWTNSRRDILEACKRAGIAPVTWNDLRRTNATLLAEAGVDADLGHKLLGHSDDRMWNAVYAKPRPAALAQRLDAIFHGTESTQGPALEARKAEEIAAAKLESLGLRSRRSQVQVLAGAQILSNNVAALGEPGQSTGSAELDPLRYTSHTVEPSEAAALTLPATPDRSGDAAHRKTVGVGAVASGGSVSQLPEACDFEEFASFLAAHGRSGTTVSGAERQGAAGSWETAPDKFDPSKCDHGADHYGATEWSWCENCEPERFAWEMARAGSTRDQVRIWPALDVTPEEIERDLAPRVTS